MNNTERATEALNRYFGFADFREGQAEVIDSVLDGRDVVVVMPTGGGKSLCYQLPAMMIDGVTLVVSPLIALMKDQVDALVERGIATTFINSSLTYSETNKRLNELRRGVYKLVYVAPERFRSRAFVGSIEETRVKLLAIDEAHCISHWGHDFRPDYLRLKEAAAVLGDLTNRGAMSGFAMADSGRHTHTTGRLDLVQIKYFAGIECAEVHRLVQFLQKAFQVRTRTVADVETVHRDCPQLKQSEP